MADEKNLAIEANAVVAALAQQFGEDMEAAFRSPVPRFLLIIWPEAHAGEEDAMVICNTPGAEAELGQAIRTAETAIDRITGY